MISISRYGRLFATPDVKAALVASIIGRVPVGMGTLAIMLFVQSRVASFARAGVVSSLYVLGLALVAPFLGRLIDRAGPRPVLAVCALAYPCAVGALLALVDSDASPWLVALNAMIVGAVFPPVTICMRALYPRVLTDPGLLQAAYSLDSALIELVFILGPALVAGFVAAGRPDLALLFAAGCGLVGCTMFLRTPAMRAWSRATQPLQRSLLGPLIVPELRAVLSATVLYSLAFGMFEVAVTAFAAKQGMPGAAGVLLALASVGSALGAIVYGGGDWRWPAETQFVVALSAMATGILVLAPIGNIYLFGALAVVACAPMAPVIAVQSVLISRVTPRPMLAEGFTWGATMLLVGVSAGVALGGVLVDRLSPAMVCAGAGTATLLAALVGWSVRARIAGAPVRQL